MPGSERASASTRPSGRRSTRHSASGAVRLLDRQGHPDELGPRRRSPEPHPVVDLLLLQRAAGNQAVAMVMAGVRPEATDRSRRSAAARQPVAQRDLAVQVRRRPGSGPLVIREVEIVGRPQGYWTDTMGDHTTAFSVHVEGVRSRLRGRTIDQAVSALRELIAGAKALPGVSLVENLPEELRRKYEESRARVDQLAEVANNVAELQDLIAAYVHFREMIPGSAIKTKLKSGYFGKGRGESGHVEKLLDYEDGQGDKTSVLNAVRGLFDKVGVGMMAVETDPGAIAEMAPGLISRGLMSPPRRETPESRPVPMETDLAATTHEASAELMEIEPSSSESKTPAIDQQSLERARTIWLQHCASIRLAFPTSYAAVKDELEKLDIGTVIKEELIRDINQDKDVIAHSIARAVIYRTDMQEPWTTLRRNKKKRDEYMSDTYTGNARLGVAYRARRDALDEATNWLDRGIVQHELLQRIDKSKADAIAFPVEEYREAIRAAGTRPGVLVNTGGAASLGTRYPTPQISQEDPSRSKKRKREEDSDRPTKTTRTDQSSTPSVSAMPPREARQPFAIQIRTAADDTVVELITGGRPPSPFPGTMGAHTTSWIVHIDRIRRLITGKSPMAAVKEITKVLLPEVKQLKTDLSEVLVPGRAHTDMLAMAERELDATIGAARDEKPDILFLQTYLHKVLAYTNLIPGVTLPKLDTRGHGEGTFRTTLVDYEQADELGRRAIGANVLRAAIEGLYDHSRTGRPWYSHLGIVSHAYPHAFEASGLASELKGQV